MARRFPKWFSGQGIGGSRRRGSDGGIAPPITDSEPVPCDIPRTIVFSGRSRPSARSSSRTASSPSPTSSPRTDSRRPSERSRPPGTTGSSRPLVTLWVFLGQVLAADPSCRAAVARLIAHRVARGQQPCSSETGAYCQARRRLPERFFAVIARTVGRRLDERVDPRWLWKGRRVYMFDGSTVAMPDTPENRAEYPLTYNQMPGTCFPSRGSGRSSRCRAGRSSIWGSAATPARVRGRSACCGGSGTSCAPAMSCWGTA